MKRAQRGMAPRKEEIDASRVIWLACCNYLGKHIFKKSKKALRRYKMKQREIYMRGHFVQPNTNPTDSTRKRI